MSGLQPHVMNPIEESDSELSSLSSDSEINIDQGVRAYTAKSYRRKSSDGKGSSSSVERQRTESSLGNISVDSAKASSIKSSKSSGGVSPLGESPVLFGPGRQSSFTDQASPKRLRKRTLTQESTNWLRRKSTALDPLQIGENGAGLAKTYSRVDGDKLVSDKLFGLDLMGGKKNDEEAAGATADAPGGPRDYGDLDSIPSDDMVEMKSENGTLSRIATLRKTATEAFERKIGFLNPEFQKFKLILKFVRVYLIIGLFVMGLFSLYWGSLYGRQTRTHNMKVLCVLEDESSANYISNCFNSTVHNATLAPKAGWELVNESQLMERHPFNTSERSVYEQLEVLVHNQDYWGAIYIHQNASVNFRNAILTGNSSFNPSALIDILFETGRDILIMQSVLVTSIRLVEKQFLVLATEQIYKPIIAGLNETALLSTMRDTALLTTPIEFTYNDLRPMGPPVVQAPQQMGIVYLHILSFFQFNFFLPVHTEVAKKVKSGSFLVYRLLSSQLSYLVLSLFYCIVQLCFQIPLNRSYEHGFAVLWMVTYLTMGAIGGANENMALLCLSTRPPYLGVWMLFWVIWNVAPTYSAMALTPHFYRYGYAFPMHNGSELVKVVLFDTTREQMGRNIGILVAWIILMNALLPFTVKYFLYRQDKK
ncbi:unnamed protein product [Kuraishia capsulata CBS 1993]|uniref:DUF3533 domain-containing protein n=1 Tax=Kuraishia capsulata CBS 1993 TaxID=1382522 RepID=W6MN55_9ASCO|nr:uncharacterized protein KUCA_T00004040001 [Kuraishia capsulata CBS 1993]CDK28059.1 unnamed protein product [Kuraishia capsulata CBS 1993]